MDASKTQQEVDAWNKWNEYRERELEPLSRLHGDIVLQWLEKLKRRDLVILDAGCGAGWLAAMMRPFGRVTGIDLADKVLERARERWPEVEFVAGDFAAAEFPEGGFDAVTSVEVLSHVPDQPGYIAKIARLLKPGGRMIMITQNRPVLELNDLPPPKGWLRRWVSKDELRAMVAPHLHIISFTTVEPKAKRGLLRLLTARRVIKAFNALSFGFYQKGLQALGFGWSIICIADNLPML